MLTATASNAISTIRICMVATSVIFFSIVLVSNFCSRSVAPSFFLQVQHFAKRFMRPEFVVSGSPVRGRASHLSQGFELVAVKHFLSIRSVEAFNKSVLHETTGLDKPAFDAMPSSPLREFLADQFGTVVYAQLRGFPADLDQLVECTQGRRTRVGLIVPRGAPGYR